MRDGQTSSELESVDWHVLLGHLAPLPLHTHCFQFSGHTADCTRKYREKKALMSAGRGGVLCRNRFYVMFVLPP